MLERHPGRHAKPGTDGVRPRCPQRQWLVALDGHRLARQHHQAAAQCGHRWQHHPAHWRTPDSQRLRQLCLGRCLPTTGRQTAPVCVHRPRPVRAQTGRSGRCDCRPGRLHDQCQRHCHGKLYRALRARNSACSNTTGGCRLPVPVPAPFIHRKNVSNAAFRNHAPGQFCALAPRQRGADPMAADGLGIFNLGGRRTLAGRWWLFKQQHRRCGWGCSGSWP